MLALGEVAMGILNDVSSGVTSALRAGAGGRVRGARSQPGQPLQLWEFEACPFCRKVREGLSELDLEYVCHPTARGSNLREDVPDFGGRKYFPYLVDPNTGAAMKESEDILDYLHETYGEGRSAAARMRAPLRTASSVLASGSRPRARHARESAARREQPAEPLVLYQFEACPFCRKVREKLNELNLVHLVKSCAKGSPRRDELVARAGKAAFPYLIDPNTGTEMFESDDIVDYLERVYG